LTVMPELTDLNPLMAACWKLVWNVEPLALMVPLAAAALEVAPAAEVDAPDAAGVDELDDELDEEQAARASAAMTAPPATAACLLPRSCI
jgi:hypothetical protein